MATLHVRNVPEAIYAALRERAAQSHTSISVEALRLIERALQMEPPGVVELLDRHERHRVVVSDGTLSAAHLIRRDRHER